MFEIFNQPYPALDPASTQLRRAGLIGLFVGLFLLTFQPFNLSLWETDNKTVKILGFGLITFVVTAVHFTVWPLLFPNAFAEERWTVGKTIAFVLANVLLIAVVNYLYLIYLLEIRFATHNLLWMLLATSLIGIFPTTGTVLAAYIRQLRKYRDSAPTLLQPASPALPIVGSSSERAAPTPAAPNVLTLIADNEKDRLTLTPADLLYIESSDNYCTVVYEKAGKTTKVLLRSSLGRLESQVADAGRPNRIIRCHRSFVVNLDRVERVTGNAQGYKLHLAGDQTVVPVARKYNDLIRQA
jgi:hypothetical protein